MNVPKLRFNGYSEGWKTVSLSDVSKINPKSKLPAEFEYVDLESVVGTEIISHRLENRETAPSRAQRVAMAGDIFYQTVRPYQKNNCYFSINDGMPYVFSTGYAQLRPSIDGYFLFSILQQERFVNNVLIRCTGTSYPAINSTDLASISIQIPVNREEQCAIGALFRNLDSKITLKQKEYDALQEAKKGFLQKIFSQEIRFKRDDGGEYPEWEDCTISEPHKKKLIDPRKFPNKLFSEYSMPAYDENKTPYHKYGNEMDSSRIIVDKPSILMNKLNIRKKRIWNVLNPEKNAIASAEFVPVFPGCNIQGFIYQYLQSNIVTEKLLAFSSGSSNSQKRVQPEDILTMVLPMPCLEEQQKIANFLSTLDEKIETVRRDLEGWKTVKKGLLQQMFC